MLVNDDFVIHQWLHFIKWESFNNYRFRSDKQYNEMPPSKFMVNLYCNWEELAMPQGHKLSCMMPMHDLQNNDTDKRKTYFLVIFPNFLP